MYKKGTDGDTMYYNQQGQPIDIYGRLLNSQYPPYQKPPDKPINNEWDLGVLQSDKKGNSSTIPFVVLKDDDNIQEVGNREARLGDILYYYNQSTGELYKKYCDFLSGLIVLEKAQFEKHTKKKEDIPPDARIDDLYLLLESLQKEVDELKSKKGGKND